MCGCASLGAVCKWTLAERPVVVRTDGVVCTGELRLSGYSVDVRIEEQANAPSRREVSESHPMSDDV